MKILSVFVEGFGCLKQKEYSFSGGLNALFLDNGEGKSTLAAFIKAMFYGLENTRSGKIEENGYLKHKPFDGGQFGGNLIFEKGGKKYRIERYFDAAKSGKEDFKLYCGGVLSNDYSGKIGEELFGLDGEGFEKSVYLPQKEVDRKVNDSITARLSSLIESSGEELSCDEALKLLDLKRREYKLEKGKGGKIYAQEGEIFRLKGELRQSRDSIVNAASIAASQKEIGQRLEEIDKEIKEIESKITQVRKTELKKHLKEEFYKLKSECRQIEQTQEEFLQSYGSFEDAGKIIEDVRDLNSYLEILKNKEKDKDTALIYKEQKNSGAYKKTMLMCIPLWAVSLILILAGIFTVRGDTVTGVVLLVLGFIALFAGVFIFIFYKISKKTQDVPLGEIKSPYQSQMLQIEEELREKEIKYGGLQSLNDAAEGYRSGEIILAQKRESLQSILNNADFDASFEPYPFTAQDLERDKEAKKQTERKLLDGLANLKTQYESQMFNAQREGGILLSIKEAEEKLEEYEGEFEALKGAINFLERARENLKTSYLPQMNDNFKKYIKYFNNPLELALDRELEIKLTHGGKTQSGSHLSKGFWDLADFCCRLALAEALSKEGQTLLILDDPFVNFDDQRVNLAKELIINLAKERQIIYFTCHTSRKIN